MKKILIGPSVVLPVLMMGCNGSDLNISTQEVLEALKDTNPPVAGADLVATPESMTSVALSWGMASDGVSDATELQYKVVKASDSALIDTVAEADAVTGGDVVQDWTIGLTSKNVTSLSIGTAYSFSVLVRDKAGNMTLYAPRSATTWSDTTSPLPGAALTATAQSASSVALAWGAASDDVTTAAELQYKVVRASASTAIDTVAEADAVTGSDLLQDWASGFTSKIVTSLSTGTSYSFSILVKDAAGNMSLYAPQSATTLAGYRIFITSAGFSGSRIGGVAGGDAKCQEDPNKPVGSGAFKALLVDGTARVACTSANCGAGGLSEHVDWVFKPSTPYIRNDGTLIGSTDTKGLMLFPMTNSIGTMLVSVPTGLTGGWLTSGKTCGGWENDGDYYSGYSSYTSSIAFESGTYGNCSYGVRLYCVEQ